MVLAWPPISDTGSMTTRGTRIRRGTIGQWRLRETVVPSSGSFERWFSPSNDLEVVRR
jgi:hypothetical protein